MLPQDITINSDGVQVAYRRFSEAANSSTYIGPGQTGAAEDTLSFSRAFSDPNRVTAFPGNARPKVTMKLTSHRPKPDDPSCCCTPTSDALASVVVSFQLPRWADDSTTMELVNRLTGLLEEKDAITRLLTLGEI